MMIMNLRFEIPNPFGPPCTRLLVCNSLTQNTTGDSDGDGHHLPLRPPLRHPLAPHRHARRPGTQFLRFHLVILPCVQPLEIFPVNLSQNLPNKLGPCSGTSPWPCPPPSPPRSPAPSSSTRASPCPTSPSGSPSPRPGPPSTSASA